MSEYKFVSKDDIDILETYRVRCLQCGESLRRDNNDMSLQEFLQLITLRKWLVIDGETYCISCQPEVEK